MDPLRGGPARWAVRRGIRGGALLIGLAACVEPAAPLAEPPCPEAVDPEARAAAARWDAPAPNVLLVVLDDAGPDLLGAWEEAPDAPPTPTLDTLARRGVRFDRAYATPWCSPTRAALLTGRWGRRIGLGRALEPLEESWTLPHATTTLPEVLRDRAPDAWASALIGKWHLDSYDGPDRLVSPLDHGFDRWWGGWANLVRDHAVDGEPQGYFDWEAVDDGVLARTTAYATTATADAAIAWLRGRDDTPWLLWLAFHAAHAPWHVPPADLHPYDPEGLVTRGDRARAMIAALDHELGRVLASLPTEVRERTVVVVVGDNGSPRDTHSATRAGQGGKATVSESGLRVPLLVAGPGIAGGGRRVDAPVHVVDVLPTVAELAGAEVGDLPLDGVSFAHLLLGDGPVVRRLTYGEAFQRNGPGPYREDARSVADADGWRLVRRPDAPDALTREDGVTLAPDRLADLELPPGRPDPEALAGLDDEARDRWISLDAALDRCFPSAPDSAP